ncbi:MAG: hypothetical protein IT436_09540 [Phycisphaerales bacterium]|nr:hypothetical protein [Phycisphaerales bacterium]
MMLRWSMPAAILLACHVSSALSFSLQHSSHGVQDVAISGHGEIISLRNDETLVRMGKEFRSKLERIHETVAAVVVAPNASSVLVSTKRIGDVVCYYYIKNWLESDPDKLFQVAARTQVSFLSSRFIRTIDLDTGVVKLYDIRDRLWVDIPAHARPICVCDSGWYVGFDGSLIVARISQGILVDAHKSIVIPFESMSAGDGCGGVFVGDDHVMITGASFEKNNTTGISNLRRSSILLSLSKGTWRQLEHSWLPVPFTQEGDEVVAWRIDSEGNKLLVRARLDIDSDTMLFKDTMIPCLGNIASVSPHAEYAFGRLESSTSMPGAIGDLAIWDTTGTVLRLEETGFGGWLVSR